MINIRDLLKEMTELYPPYGMTKHSIVLYNEGLQLTLAIGGFFWPVVLNEADMEKPLEEIVSEIVKYMVDKVNA